MGRITDIAWTATPVPHLAGLDRCPLKGCKADLFVVDGVTYHPGGTFNPWWGCVKVDKECERCYADAWDSRWSPKESHWGPKAPRRFFGDSHWNEPLRFDRHAAELGVRLKLFCGSMCDWAEDREDLAPHRGRLFQLIRRTENIDWLMLSKRPLNAARVLPWMRMRSPDVAYHAPGECAMCGWHGSSPLHRCPPWPNVWIGTTAGHQKGADVRVHDMLATIDAVRFFVSVEPMLERVDIERWLRPRNLGELRKAGSDEAVGSLWSPRKLHWVIAGSESGPGARVALLEWYDDLAEQCERNGTPFLLKQFARKGIKIRLPMLDGRQRFEFPEAVAA